MSYIRNLHTWYPLQILSLELGRTITHSLGLPKDVFVVLCVVYAISLNGLDDDNCSKSMWWLYLIKERDVSSIIKQIYQVLECYTILNQANEFEGVKWWFWSYFFKMWKLSCVTTRCNLREEWIKFDEFLLFYAKFLIF